MEELTNEQVILRCIKKEKPEIYCGIYLLIKNDDIVYIGKSVDITQRIKDHCRVGVGKEFDYYLIFPCDKSQLDTYERNFIDRFYPKYNNDSKTMNRKIRIIKDVLEHKIDRTPQDEYILSKLEQGASWNYQRREFVYQMGDRFFTGMSSIKNLQALPLTTMDQHGNR